MVTNVCLSTMQNTNILNLQTEEEKQNYNNCEAEPSSGLKFLLTNNEQFITIVLINFLVTD